MPVIEDLVLAVESDSISMFKSVASYCIYATGILLAHVQTSVLLIGSSGIPGNDHNCGSV